MLFITKVLREIWEFINRIHPETRSIIIILLFGWIMYSQITVETAKQIDEKHRQEIVDNKRAELYSRESAIEINLLVQLIAEIDEDAFDVLLLNYHNNTQSLQGYKYLYLSCLTEAPRSLDTPVLQQLWNKLDYVYYADELYKIHSLSFVKFESISKMLNSLPKLYRLVKGSEAEAVSFFTIEGYDSQIGLIIILYKKSKTYDYRYAGKILPHILKLALLLDYERNCK